ncbi:unnamed protein product [Ectocarpus sp. 13 AM-2016]
MRPFRAPTGRATRATERSPLATYDAGQCTSELQVGDMKSDCHDDHGGGADCIDTTVAMKEAVFCSNMLTKLMSTTQLLLQHAGKYLHHQKGGQMCTALGLLVGAVLSQ